MKFVLFYHAITSCWNNGNAHFLRGVARELAALGHSVVVYEPGDGWSRRNAILDGGTDTLAAARRVVSGVEVRQYDEPLDSMLDHALAGADVVIVHEWNAPSLVTAIARRRAAGGAFTLLFHDTHHRAVTAPDQLSPHLDGFDAVLAFGEILRDIYLKQGWARRAFTWHEAADTALFAPAEQASPTDDVVWIGNWGDDERSAEIAEYLIAPAATLRLSGSVFGVRYPEHAIAALRRCGLLYRGWLPNHAVADAFAAARMTVHIPRGPYANALPGIPTIRMFEALACGIPLISAPWRDDEQMFPDGAYLRVSDRHAMREAMSAVLADRDLAASLRQTGLAAIHARHTCRHRVNELMSMIRAIRGDRSQSAEPALSGAVAP
ncbi:hypothetical protein X566_01160 [Afipia sp. P52-10]|uniref:CgeB family protein n=1 Tax=Afipia sp. P52-10 TaxID=1429916 RepID=UPI0003DF0FAF|nr:glycosyltransferase [Afipia sp. P52-10]ETR79245.1 hypothetical protein X566_01160 [Afipia sp. P52-10]